SAWLCSGSLSENLGEPFGELTGVTPVATVVTWELCDRATQDFGNRDRAAVGWILLSRAPSNDNSSPRSFQGSEIEPILTEHWELLLEEKDDIGWILNSLDRGVGS